MPKLVISMNPVTSTEIFEVTATDELKKLLQVNQPLDMIKYLANYMTNVNESTEVTFIGPDDYINPWIIEANQFKFVNAHKIKKEK